MFDIPCPCILTMVLYKPICKKEFLNQIMKTLSFIQKKNNCNKMKKGSTFGKLSQSMCFYGVKKCLISFKLSL